MSNIALPNPLRMTGTEILKTFEVNICYSQSEFLEETRS